MVSVAKLPEYLSQNHYKNPLGARGGPWQCALGIEETLWEWLAQRPDKLQECNTFMEGDRGSRPSWLEWFPVQERVIDGFQGGDNDVFLVDIAGGRGHDISDFKKKFPNAPGRFVLEDLPLVIDDVQDVDAAVERVKIDFFKDQPVKGSFSLLFVECMALHPG
jgi:hypothetical protein